MSVTGAVPAGQTAALPPPRPRRLGPAWPLIVLLAGYPLFWVAGLSAFALPVMAVPMAVILYRRRPLKLPRGFALWALFLVWSVFGVFLLGINPQGFVPGAAGGRLFGFGMRELSYFSVTILLLFIGNLSEKELPQSRLVRLLGVFFVTVVAGGLLGMLVPQLQFTSLFEMFLPGSIRSNDFVQSLVHPRAAQVQELLTDATPRPAAPFSYTNAWGFHLTLLGVWFVVARFFLKGSRAKLFSLFVLVAGLVVLVYSLNRAAWMGVAVAVAYVAIRLALRGRLVMVASLVFIGAIAGGAVLATPLGEVVSARLENGKSDNIRAFTTEKAFELSAQSPVAGFGTTRSTFGSSSSIAVGKSAQCPACGNASIGMNGYFYMLIVTTGYVGAALFFGFGALQVWRTRSIWSPVVVAGSTVILMTGFYAFFYDGATWLLVPFATLGILWREERAAAVAVSEGVEGVRGGVEGVPVRRQGDGRATLPAPSRD
ncbi:hypothetical protein [Mumia sp. Pv 4-285]|uniref:hypothetical protein n=1 Tax=Mumia qirimensis TaxID=3234852 RepID=UPI00351D6B05